MEHQNKLGVANWPSQEVNFVQDITFWGTQLGRCPE